MSSQQGLVRLLGTRTRTHEGTDTLMLEDKVAVVYGAGGAIGGAVASAFAKEGARVFVTGRHRGLVA